MSEIHDHLGNRLRTLVASEEASAGLRSNIEEQLRRPLQPSTTAPRVWALAGVVAAFVVGSVALTGGPGSSDSDQQVSASTPAASGDPAPAPAPDLPHGRSSTRVLAADATGTPGTAEATLQTLRTAGYIGVGSMDAPVQLTTTRVYFAPGFESEAQDVATLLGLGASAVDRPSQPVPEPNGADVLVVIGEDMLGTPAGDAAAVPSDAE